MDRSGYINLKTLTMDELAGVVNLYPWYGAARRELCVRMAKMGGNAWGKEQYADAAMYLGDRRVVADIVRDRAGDYSDKDLSTLLHSYISDEKKTQGYERTVHVVGGDYFTQAQYDTVRKDDDNVFSRFAVKSSLESGEDGDGALLDEDFCTETLAQIYAEQGYYDQAKRIYSRLLLKNPEKNAYFAAHIEKFGQEI